jgi:hypothetical protein
MLAYARWSPVIVVDGHQVYRHHLGLPPLRLVPHYSM